MIKYNKLMFLSIIIIVFFINIGKANKTNIRYYCNTNKTSTIKVNLQRQSGFQACNDIIQTINQDIKNIEENLEELKDYNNSNQYRIDLEKNLINQKTNLQNYKDQLKNAIYELESSLFNKLHTVIKYQIEQKINIEEINQKIKKYESERLKAKLNNSLNKFELAAQKHHNQKYKKYIIQQIQNAKDLQTLIEFLKKYKKL